MLRLFMTVLWPSFLVATVAEGCFFSVFDPRELVWVHGESTMSALGTYTLGFFFFWLVCASSSALTYYLSRAEVFSGTSSKDSGSPITAVRVKHHG